jgi:hypothetical protein
MRFPPFEPRRMYLYKAEVLRLTTPLRVGVSPVSSLLFLDVSSIFFKFKHEMQWNNSAISGLITQLSCRLRRHVGAAKNPGVHACAKYEKSFSSVRLNSVLKRFV